MMNPAYVGTAEVMRVFRAPDDCDIAGCVVIEGIAHKAASVELVREKKHIWAGRLLELRRFSEDPTIVSAKYECGVILAGGPSFTEGDLLEFYMWCPQAVTKEAAR